LGGHEDQVASLPATQALDCIQDGLGLKHHPSAAAVRPIVHSGMTVTRIDAKIVDRDLDDLSLLGPLENALRKGSLKEARKECEDVILPQLRSSLPGDGPE
jgi:hypothetical protein